MTDKGRHASDGGGAFYRDLAMMILGIVLVGGAVFFLLFLIADGPDSATTTVGEPASTTTTGQSTTTSEVSTSSSTSTTPTTTTPTSTTVPVKPPEEVRVVVLNSTQLTGAAGRMTQQLDDAGYQTMQASDYTPEQDPSRIWYREGHSAEANELLEFLPDARVEPLPDDSIQPGADVVMILGTGYDG